MTLKEFGQWRMHHLALFPGLMHHFSKELAQEPGALEILWQEWFAILKSIELKDAIAASRRLAATDYDGPRGYDRHPFIVKDIARHMRASRGEWDAMPAEPCADCGGVGAIVIKKAGGYQAAVRCTCKAGERNYPFLRPFHKELDERA